MEQMIYHSVAVTRGARRAHVVGDLPFMSYQVTPQEAVRNAGRLVSEGGVGSVKLEGGAEFAEVVSAIVRASIPVMGHLGLTPQSVHKMGGYVVQGATRTPRARFSTMPSPWRRPAATRWCWRACRWSWRAPSRSA